MTKSLTEKWKDMDFTDNHLYYWRMPNGEVRIMNKLGAYSYKLCYDGGKIEILAPVPSYDEYKELTQKVGRLELDSEAQDQVIQRLQEQLNEANEALKELVGFGVVTEKTKAEYTDPDDWECTCVADEYLEKWGIPSEKCKEQGDFPSKKCKEVK